MTVALWVMIGVSAAACVLLVFNFFRPRWKAMAIGAVTYVALYIIAIVLVPALFQKFVVQPNELSLETPYLKNYIEFTRKAYKLDGIQETAYPAMADLTPAVWQGIRTRSRTFGSGISAHCFRPISRPRRYGSITSSTTCMWTATIWRMDITR